MKLNYDDLYLTYNDKRICVDFHNGFKEHEKEIIIETELLNKYFIDFLFRLTSIFGSMKSVSEINELYNENLFATSIKNYDDDIISIDTYNDNIQTQYKCILKSISINNNENRVMNTIIKFEIISKYKRRD